MKTHTIRQAMLFLDLARDALQEALREIERGQRKRRRRKR
jgi:hypothetical protein